MSRYDPMVNGASLSMTLADVNGELVLINQTARELFESLREQLPMLYDNILGTSIDELHGQLLSPGQSLKNTDILPVAGQLSVGEETFKVEVKAMYNSHGEFIGPKATWECISEQVRNEALVAAQRAEARARRIDLEQNVVQLLKVVDRMQSGDLTQSVPVCDGEIGKVFSGIDHLMVELRSSLQSVGLSPVPSARVPMACLLYRAE